MDRFALTRQIRFALDELGARNGHHAFEELCRFLVSERIISNVYPSTGPVAAGGDGGRDFQTFTTHIIQALGPGRGFAALASGEPAVFACTLQKSGIPTKIRRDLREIVKGASVTRVYALLGGNVNEAKQQELKKEALEKYSVTLEILDGEALAELLAHHDTFWIAARWLGLPAELAPDPPAGGDDLPAWYQEARERWRSAEGPPRTMAELLDVREGLRRATFHADARPDIGLWLTRMAGACADSELPERLRQRARYEMAVGQLRGAQDLRPADGHVQAFFEDIDPGTATWAELTDAVVLLQYVTGAALARHTSLGVEWIDSRYDDLAAHIDRRLKEGGETPGQRAGLFSVKGQMCAFPPITDDDLPAEPQTALDPLVHGMEAGIPIPSDSPMRDPDGVIAAWTKFAKLARTAPLVPVEAVSDMLALLTPVLVTRDGYRELIAATDQLVADVAGASAAAERSRDRALALVREGRPLDALADLHDAKARWWNGDTVRGSLMAMLILADCYEQLGLFMAARQHALVAVGAAHAVDREEHGDLMASGLMKAAHLDYHMGAWCSAAESYRVALIAHAVHREDPWNPHRHVDLVRTELAAFWMRHTAELVGAGLAQQIKAAHDETGLSDIIDAVEAPDDMSAARVATSVRDQLGIAPWNDAGPDRVIRWSALGLEWEIKAVNTYANVRAAERLAAAAQILCAEMAAADLVLMPTTIRVNVRAADDMGANRERLHSRAGNDGSDWDVDLLPLIGDGSNLDSEEVALELMTVMTSLLYEASVAPWARHEAAIDRLYQRGLPHKIGAGRPYDDVACVVPREVFEATGRQNMALPIEWRGAMRPDPHASLAWRTGPGPGYNRDEHLRMIRRRYERSLEWLPKTVERLSRNRAFVAVADQLRKRGWKDWHLLLALGNARLNIRNEEGGTRSLAQMRKPDLTPETDADLPLPAETLTVEHLDFMRRMAIVHAAQMWGLEVHQDTPDLDALDKLLGDRYGYWDDDVPHDPIFLRIEDEPA